AATVTVSAPNCLTIRHATTSPSSLWAMPRRTEGPSRTSVTSPRSTGVVPRTATTVCRRSSGVRTRPTPRTVHSVAPCTTGAPPPPPAPTAPPRGPPHDEPPRHVHVGSRDGVQHLVQRDSTRGHPLRI